MLKVRLKEKKCRNTECREQFMPSRPMQVACTPKCALVLARLDREKKAAKATLEKAKQERAEHREAKERIKSRGDHAKDAQTAFNAWVRERDFDKPCVSCGNYHQGQWHAGHYLTVGARPELRFEPDNCHKQCAPCNNHLSGNLILYRVTLVGRIGTERVDWLEGPHDAKHYSIDDLKAITKKYRALTRELKKAREASSAN